MIIKFQDFVPEVTKGKSMFSPDTYEPFTSVVRRLNDWQDNNRKTEILSIETVVLPNINGVREEGSTDVDIHVYDESSNSMHQFIRVWYRIKY